MNITVLKIRLTQMGKASNRIRMPLVSLASQMWYWPMNSSREMFPNQAKREL